MGSAGAEQKDDLCRDSKKFSSVEQRKQERGACGHVFVLDIEVPI
jgi:hypothetical protein